MTWDYFVYILAQNINEVAEFPEGFSSGFVDEVTTRFYEGDREGARSRYMRETEGDFQIPQLIQNVIPNFSSLPSPHWLGIQVDFELLTPWYSKDDRLFHVMDNPVRKDRVFGVPFMAASSWKGMLRWACRMEAGLLEHLEKHGGKLEGWRDPNWILHLFGNEKEKKENFHRGALVFFPTWFNKIGFEVINPHDRKRRAGTKPIYYEVVPGRRIKVERKPDGSEEKVEIEGAKGTLFLLYAPWPGMKPEAEPVDVLMELLKAIEKLLTTYGISAKRTVGWGTANILRWRAFHKERGTAEKNARDGLWNEIQGWLSEGGSP